MSVLADLRKAKEWYLRFYPDDFVRAIQAADDSDSLRYWDLVRKATTLYTGETSGPMSVTMGTAKASLETCLKIIDKAIEEAGHDAET